METARIGKKEGLVGSKASLVTMRLGRKEVPQFSSKQYSLYIQHNEICSYMMLPQPHMLDLHNKGCYGA